MNAYLMNGLTNTVTPLNATNRALPMNEPVTIIMASIAAANAIAGIIARRRQSKKEKAEAHTAFMHEVYKIPGLTNQQHTMLHQMAENNLGDAARWVENYLAAKIVEAEEAQKREAEAAAAAAARNANPAANQRQNNRDSGSRSQVEAQTDELLDNPPNNYDGATPRIKSGWWADRSKVEKGIIIGGATLATGGIIYLATRKRKKGKRK